MLLIPVSFVFCSDHHACGLLVPSLVRTQSEPNPALQAVPEQSEHVSSHSQPVDHAPYRPRRPPSKQQRVLSAVPRLAGKESIGVRTSSGSTESRTSGVEASRAFPVSGLAKAVADTARSS